MSWGVPNTGQWSAPVGMAADMSMGSLTPEQWAAIQQQNWQQWAQWHQQYTQWQSQYGEKYAEQFQAYQAMGKMPPLPPANAAPPPAPPPPDQPPPPPHENNQPLFGQATGNNQSQPAPVPPPHQGQNRNTGMYTNAKPVMVEQNRTGQPNIKIEPSSNTDSDALNKLAEEEKLFDIQFQKWEQEIEKWRKENMNHPDKEAYKEYEQKFETCRAQLMERRQQMKLKRAKLLGNGQLPQPQTPSNTVTATQSGQNIINKNDFEPDIKPQIYQNLNMPPQQQYMPQNNTTYQNHQQGGHSSYNRNSNNISVPQDPYNVYQNINENLNKYAYPPAQVSQPNQNSEFMPKANSEKGIPGLDLVVEKNTAAKNQEADVITIGEDHEDVGGQQSQMQKPDYSTISRGINSILGDEKIMNILSMVRGNNVPNMSQSTNQPQNAHQPNEPYYSENNNFAHNQQQGRYQHNYNNPQLNNRQNMPYDRPDLNYPHQQNFNPKFPPMKKIHDERQPNMMPEQYYDRNFQPNVPSIRPPLMGAAAPRPAPAHMLQPDPKPNRLPALLDLPVTHNINHNYPRGPPETDGLRQSMQVNNITAHQEIRPPQPKWIEEPLFTPSIIVEYEHKPLRLKARDFIEPVHIFEYNHKSKNEDTKKKDFEKEADEVFLRKPKRDRDEEHGAYPKFRADYYNTDFERRAAKDDFRNDRLKPREDFDRRRADDRFDDRRRDDRDKYMRRDDFRDSRDNRDRDRERERDRYRDYRREDNKNRSRSLDRESRKREHKGEESNNLIKRSKDHDASPTPVSKDSLPKHIVMIDDLLEMPGREIRPEKIVIILRGPPGSGKSYLAKIIRDKEAEHGGAARIMSIDDYFMQEGELEEKDPATGKTIKKPTLKYEYDSDMEETYMNSLKRAFKRTLTDGYFSFLIFDAVNDQLRHYADVWNSARQTGFQVYICTMELDPNVCFKRNIHNRSLEDIKAICTDFFPTPSHHIQLDPTTLLQNAAIPEVQMEDVENEVVMEDAEEPEVESVFTSKWEKMEDAAQLARLDGTSKPLRPSQLSMEHYLQLDDWTPNAAKPGKKTVRWADLEERRQQEKMRAIGFVVGQTDWNRMTDPTMGSGALTQTKYIERVRRT